MQRPIHIFSKKSWLAELKTRVGNTKEYKIFFFVNFVSYNRSQPACSKAM